jgi:hypothetical protein
MKRLRVVLVEVVAFPLMACGGAASALPSPTAVPSASAIVFPPTTLAQAKALAATGDPNAVQEFHSEGVGLPACPQPKRSVTMAAGLTGRQVAADLLRYFYDQQLNNECGALVLAYSDASQYGTAYTVGRVNLSVNGTSHQLEVDSVADNIASTIRY